MCKTVAQPIELIPFNSFKRPVSYSITNINNLVDRCLEDLFFFFFRGLLLIFINPVQFPLHEPYFDLTPIKVTHTKAPYINVSIKRDLIIFCKYIKKPNLLHILLSAPDEWLVPD